MSDPYQVLGVTKSASQDEIKSAYRRLAKKFHPDVNPGDKKAEDKFKSINQAFDAVGDAERRKLFDEFGEAALSPGFDKAKADRMRAYRRGGGGPGGPGAGAGVWNVWTSRGGTGPGGADDPLSGFSFEGGENIEDLFESLRGGGGGRGRGGRGRGRARAQRGGDIRGEVIIDLAEAVRGTTKTFAVTSPDDSVKRLKVKVPPGADSGTVIRLGGQGGAGAAGGEAGDILLTVRVLPHPLLERDGNDLLLDLPVTVGEAAAGATVRVPTFEGDVKLKVPPGSSGGTKLRLRGRGVPDPHSEGRGDLIAVVRIVLPPASDRLAELGRGVDELYPGDVRADLKL